MSERRVCLRGGPRDGQVVVVDEVCYRLAPDLDLFGVALGVYEELGPCGTDGSTFVWRDPKYASTDGSAALLTRQRTPTDSAGAP